jgi:hypothetical protein
VGAQYASAALRTPESSTEASARAVAWLPSITDASGDVASDNVVEPQAPAAAPETRMTAPSMAQDSRGRKRGGRAFMARSLMRALRCYGIPTRIVPLLYPVD